MRKIARVRSGGQSGVDRAALDAARTVGISIEGWVPKHGWAEDYPTDPGVTIDYPELESTDVEDVSYRTKLNVRDSHATLILSPPESSSAGTSLTVETARRYRRPYFVSDLNDLDDVVNWITELEHEISLNVGGPRESEAPGVYARSMEFLKVLFQRVTHLSLDAAEA